jgi:hypothetical protein
MADNPSKKALEQLALLEESRRLHYGQHTGEGEDEKMAQRNIERMLKDSLNPKPKFHIQMPEGSDPSKW